MDRRKLLAIAVGVVGIINIIWYIWANWGLITVHEKNAPLSKIIRSIEKQGGITLKTDLDPKTPVTMNVTKVPLTEALETLATTTESRWRVNYVLAADKASLKTGIDNFSLENKSDDWKLISYPAPAFVSFGFGQVPDPRVDSWQVKPPADKTTALQSYLTEAAQFTDIGFAVPKNWNPPVKSAPASGPLRKVVPKLASATRSKIEEIFVLSQERRWRGAGRGPNRGDGNDGPPGGMNFDWMAERTQNQINKLPPEERSLAQADFDKERAFFQSLRDLTAEERRQKMMEHMNDPDAQARADQRQANQDARRTPEQREQRYQHYIQNKIATQGRP